MKNISLSSTYWIHFQLFLQLLFYSFHSDHSFTWNFLKKLRILTEWSTLMFSPKGERKEKETLKGKYVDDGKTNARIMFSIMIVVNHKARVLLSIHIPMRTSNKVRQDLINNDDLTAALSVCTVANVCRVFWNLWSCRQIFHVPRDPAHPTCADEICLHSRPANHSTNLEPSLL